jgi:pyocin large subunit-like protein
MLGVVATLVFFWLKNIPPNPPLATQVNQSSQQATQTWSNHSDIGFASQEKLVQHYKKHGREFGDITMDEYLRQAQELRDRPLGGSVLEKVRTDRVITRFDRTNSAFLAFNPSLIIRTYFKPNDGEAYFHRQAQSGSR